MPATLDTAFTLRAARAGDLDALDALEQRCFSGDRLSRRSFRRQLRIGHSGLIVALANEQLAGYVLVLLHHARRLARLYSIAVAPNWRGHGLGECLMQAAEDLAREHGRQYLQLEVRRDNATAIRLYQRRGYERFGERASYYEDGADALRFRKPLHVAARERE